MIDKILKETGNSLWREVRDDAVKKLVGTTIVEGVKAVVDVWKKRQIRLDQFEFDTWKGQQDPESAAEEASEGEDTPVEDSPTEDEPD